MISVCWAAKGGSGTTVVAAAMTIAATSPTLLIDLAGDVPAVLGIPEPDGPGVFDWLASDAGASLIISATTSGPRAIRILSVPGDRDIA